MTLHSKLRVSIAAVPELSDDRFAAARELAITYARQIDSGVKVGGQDATKALYLGPHLLKTLGELELLPPKEARPLGRPRKPSAPETDDPGGEEVAKDDLAAARERHRRRRA